MKRRRTFSNSKRRWYCLSKRVLRLGQNANQRGFVEIVHDACDREAADKFGNQAIANQVARLDLFEQFGVALLRGRWRGIGVEAERPAANALFDNFFEADECAAANETGCWWCRPA